MHCCLEHVELAIDMYVDNEERAPQIIAIPVDKQTKLCEFCAKQAEYIVGNECF
ncbi:CxxH/CxxC protein [Anoxybacteroides amylolyticum]|uniref:YyzF-like family protein n=1 Tax=Anoxybacteroides amylolyticum TaxID=294699 RepID=A0A167T4X6_9BACL|nr:CxxH/CxxC protein [Anoxybacillus amylolyticus]ANB59456.1 yyzF-like family protein [Anoxybacillus amylolyticus]